MLSCWVGTVSVPVSANTLQPPPYPKGPKIEKIQDRPPGLKFSIEIENFKRATQQTPIFLWGILKVKIEKFNLDLHIFKRHWNFQSGLVFFDLWALRVKWVENNGFWSMSRNGFEVGFWRILTHLCTQKTTFINSVHTRCIVKNEGQKSPLFWRFSGGFWFSQDRLLSRNSTRKPLNLINPGFLQTPLVKPLVFTMRLVCTL